MDMISFIGNNFMMKGDAHHDMKDMGGASKRESFDTVLAKSDSKVKPIANKQSPKGKVHTVNNHGEKEFAPSPTAPISNPERKTDDVSEETSPPPQFTLRGEDVEIKIDLSAIMKQMEAPDVLETGDSEFSSELFTIGNMAAATNLASTPSILPKAMMPVSFAPEPFPMLALEPQESQIVDQILQKLSLTQMDLHGKGKVTLALEPKELGALKIELMMDKGGLSADILTHHPLVKEILEKNQSILLDALMHAGFNVEQFSVNVGNFQDHRASDHPNEQRSHRSGMDARGGMGSLVAGIQEVLKSRIYTDSRVSLYA